MKIILISNEDDRTRSLTLNKWAKVLLSLFFLGLPVAGLFVGLQLGGGQFGFLLEDSVDEMKRELALQQAALEESEAKAEQKIKAMALNLASMQSRLVRLDALGERLTEMASLDDGEFDFSRSPALGGPHELIHSADDVDDIGELYSQLQSQLDNREQQLQILASMLTDRQLKTESAVAGQPVEKGWLSSRYGMRRDPFKGSKSWHKGVDFAAKEGTGVVAVAKGVVTWSGDRQGYGNMVEVDHGEGYVTRYGHNKANLVKVGEIVEKGQVIATVGSTGRSTGPHVHFEVYKHGRSVDPASYIHRTIR